MSCYIIGDNHAEYLAQALAGRFPCTRHHAPYLLSTLHTATTAGALVTDLMQRILSLNTCSVAARYDEDAATLAANLGLVKQIRATGRIYADTRPLQVIKSIRCALYQCEEAPERQTAPIAVALDLLERRIMYDLTEEAATVWGAPDPLGSKHRGPRTAQTA